MSTLILIGIVWVGYKGFQQWLAFKEKELRAFPPAVRTPQPEREMTDDRPEGLPLQLTVSEPPATPAPDAGMNKWLFLSLCLLYVAFPFDLVPDFIPFLGWGDDVVAIFLAIQKFMKK